MSKEELRKRIARDPQLKKDFDFLIARVYDGPELHIFWCRISLKKNHSIPSKI
jgi:hypothetical protein